MPNRDIESLKREMTHFIEHVASEFRRMEIPLEASPIASLVLAMLQDYRKNTLRDVVDDIFRGIKSIEIVKKRRWW